MKNDELEIYRKFKLGEWCGMLGSYNVTRVPNGILLNEQYELSGGKDNDWRATQVPVAPIYISFNLSLPQKLEQL